MITISRNNIMLAALALLLTFIMFFPGQTAYANAPTPFRDVSDTFWAKDSIDSLVQLGVVNGFSDHTFRPNDPVTREQFAQLTTLAFYLDLPSEEAEQTFLDVSKTRWSYPAIEASKDFLTGYYPPNGRAFYDPTGKATREDVAVALVRVLGYQPDDLKNEHILNSYYDSDKISPNLRTYVALAIENKLLTGYQDRTIRPTNAVSRAEAVELIYRVLKNAVGDSNTSLALNVDVPETTSTPTFYITGDVAKGASVYINNKEVEVIQGRFRIAIQLQEEGVYAYTISARLPGGKTESVTKQIRYERGAPELEVTGVPEISDKQKIKVSWKVKDENDSSPVVYVNDELRFYGNGSTEITLNEGENLIKVRAENKDGKYTVVVKKVIFQTDGPVITILNLPESTDQETITVSWNVQDKNDPSPQVYVNDKKMYYYETSAKMTLQEGTNTITIKAINSLGKSSEVTRTVIFAGSSPVLTVDPLPETTNKNAITVSWNVKDANDSNPTVYVNDKIMLYQPRTTVDLLEGENTITVKAVNKHGKSTVITKTVTFISEGPVLRVNPLPEATTEKSISVSWTVTDLNDSSPDVYVNGSIQHYTNNTKVQLNPGDNIITIKAVNDMGQSTEQSYTVRFDPPAPVLTLGYAPETTSSSAITLTWTISDVNDSNPKVYVNDQLVEYSNRLNVTLTPGENVFKIVASNAYGKTSEVIYTVLYTS